MMGIFFIDLLNDCHKIRTSRVSMNEMKSKKYIFCSFYEGNHIKPYLSNIIQLALAAFIGCSEQRRPCHAHTACSFFSTSG